MVVTSETGGGCEALGQATEAARGVGEGAVVGLVLLEGNHELLVGLATDHEFFAFNRVDLGFVAIISTCPCARIDGDLGSTDTSDAVAAHFEDLATSIGLGEGDLGIGCTPSGGGGIATGVKPVAGELGVGSSKLFVVSVYRTDCERADTVHEHDVGGCGIRYCCYGGEHTTSGDSFDFIRTVGAGVDLSAATLGADILGAHLASVTGGLVEVLVVDVV